MCCISLHSHSLVKWADTCKRYMLHSVCKHTHVQDTVHLSNNGPVTSSLVDGQNEKLPVRLEARRGNAAFSLREPWCLGSLPGDNAVWLWSPHGPPAKSSVKLSYTCTHALTHIHAHFVNKKVDFPPPLQWPNLVLALKITSTQYPSLLSKTFSKANSNVDRSRKGPPVVQ